MSDIERNAFEAWSEREWPRMSLIRKGDTGDYLYKTAVFAWEAWQAARPKFTALCHSKTRQIGNPVGYLIENEAGGLAAVHNLGRVTWLDDCVAGPIEKAASAQDGGELPARKDFEKEEFHGEFPEKEESLIRQDDGEPVTDFEIECDCGDIYRADSFGGGFIAGAGMCENCLTTHNSDHLASTVVPETPHAYGKDCPEGMVQVEFVGCSPTLKQGEYGWLPTKSAFLEVYVDGVRYRIDVGTKDKGKGPVRGLHIIGSTLMQVDQHSINSVSIYQEVCKPAPPKPEQES